MNRFMDRKAPFSPFGVCASLWVSDSFAYIVGSRLGKHKMAPKISPKKSWEGFFGGIVGSMIIWGILWATKLYTLIGGVHLALHGGQGIKPAGIAGVLPTQALHGPHHGQRRKLRQDILAGEAAALRRAYCATIVLRKGCTTNTRLPASAALHGLAW